MNLEDRMVDVENALSRLVENVRAMRGMERMLNDIAAGALPKRLCADMDAVREVEAVEDDEAYVAELAKIANARSPIGGMMALATLVARLKAERSRLEKRMEKLAAREEADANAEGDTAAALRLRLKEACATVDARMSATLVRFFEMRLFVLNATLKMTANMCDLWKGGSRVLRDAALKSHAMQALESLVQYEQLAERGEFKVGSSSGKGSVKI